jgi:hypothetical protein
MGLILKSFVFLLIFSILMVGVLIVGEWVTSKLPNTLWAKWWRKNVIEDGENYAD